ncbi:MAG: WecB/TagA/CpsF family glycosyltransferase, partial [Gemmatimonadota bacterium]
FEFVGGMVRRAPGWMQRSGLEWFFRLVTEPRRLWRRYLFGNVTFVWLVARQWWATKLNGDTTNAA